MNSQPIRTARASRRSRSTARELGRTERELALADRVYARRALRVFRLKETLAREITVSIAGGIADRRAGDLCSPLARETLAEFRAAATAYAALANTVEARIQTGVSALFDTAYIDQIETVMRAESRLAAIGAKIFQGADHG